MQKGFFSAHEVQRNKLFISLHPEVSRHPYLIGYVPVPHLHTWMCIDSWLSGVGLFAPNRKN